MVFRSNVCARALYQNKQNGGVNRKKYDVRSLRQIALLLNFRCFFSLKRVDKVHNKMLDLEVVPERSLGNEEWEFVLGISYIASEINFFVR